eukprot:COSAG02_NODE_2730_length_8142_cov_5.078080_4_plen_1074_part_00
MYMYGSTVCLHAASERARASAAGAGVRRLQLQPMAYPLLSWVQTMVLSTLLVLRSVADAAGPAESFATDDVTLSDLTQGLELYLPAEAVVVPLGHKMLEGLQTVRDGAAAAKLGKDTHNRRRAQATDPLVERYTRELRSGWTARLSDDNAVLATLPDGTSLLPMPPPPAAMTRCLGQNGLRDQYFSDPSASDPKIKCFSYNSTAPEGRRWPSNDGTDGDDLFDRLSTRLDWHTLVPSTAVLSGAEPDPVEFVVGQGAVCTDIITVYNAEFDIAGNTQVANATENRSCVFSGIHESDHTHLAIGEEDFEPIAGGQFAVGACTDYMIRVETSATNDAATIVWQLDDVGVNDGSHMGPWAYSHEGIIGIQEFTTCLFDNNFTLTRTSFETDGWQGMITVLGFVPDHSIYIPQDEKWIIQGGLENGIPVELNVRLASGNPFALTNASVVLRYVRQSGQTGPLDVYMTGGPLDATRPFSQRPDARMGGAFYYEGGFGAAVIFDHCVFDHNGLFGSGSGGAVMFAGRGEEITPEQCYVGLSREAIASKRDAGQPYPPTTSAGCGISISIKDSIFWSNAAWVGGGMRIVNTHPMHMSIDRVVWVDNTAIVGHDWGSWFYANMKDKFGPYDLQQRSVMYQGANRGDGMCEDETLGPTTSQGRWGCINGFTSAWNHYSFPGSDAHDDAPELDTRFDIFLHDVTVQNYSVWYTPQGQATWNEADGPGTLVWSNSTHRYNWANNLNDAFTPWDGSVFVNSPGGSNIAIFLWSHIETDSVGALAGETDFQSAADAGALRLVLTYGSGRLEYSSFKNSRARTAAAVNLMGSSGTNFTVFQCHFAYNIAFKQGGALAFRGSSLAIVNSVFLGNAIAKPAGGVILVPVYVRVHTGTMGQPPSGIEASLQALNFPVWKIDGEEPFSVCNGVCNNSDSLWQDALPWPRPINLPAANGSGAIDCRTEDGWRPGLEPKGCVDGAVPEHETVFGSNRTTDTPVLNQGSDYAEVLYLTPGPHKLWYGSTAFMADGVSGWTGGAWIDIVGLVDPLTDPPLTDNRAAPDATNTAGFTEPGYTEYVVSPGCWMGTYT